MRADSKGKVLVLGDDDRSCLTVVRSLGRQKLCVLLGAQAFISIVPWSRYVARTVWMPSTETHLDMWLAELESLLKQETVDLVIPCSDNTLVPLAHNRKIFEPLARFAIPDDAGFEYTYWKQKTFALAQKLGVDIPTTELVSRMEDLGRIESHGQLRFPLIVKPVSSKVWRQGRIFELRVKLARDWSELMRVVGEFLENAPVLIQNYFQGIGVGQEFLTCEGRIISAFQHERIHEPLKGGGSSYRKSVPLNERMLAHSREMLAYLRWTGVAMVEYKHNPVTGQFALMEINGRFWGSLPLAVAAGVDFPYQLYQLLVTGRVSTPTPDYKVGLYSRNLKKDMLWFRECFWASEKRLPVMTKEILRGLRNVLLWRERIDSVTTDDPLPGLVEISNEFWMLAERATGWIKKRIFSLRARITMWRWLQRKKIRRRLALRPNLLFVCRGNICRSPFAEAYIKLKLNSLGITGLETKSVGMYPVENRPVPEPARIAGQELGVTLDTHRSRLIRPQLVDWAGAVVCMDYRDYREIRRVFPDVKTKLFFLRSFDSRAKDFQIPDPWGKPVEEFRLCFQQISFSNEGLLKALMNR